MATAPLPIDGLRQLFFDFGFQYYIAARYSVAAWSNPVAANLMHHAIEMFLKGGLAAHTTEQDRRKLGHRLPDNWSAFKIQLSAGHLSKFDPVVDALDRYEDIRYPENILRDGVGTYFQFGKRTMPITVSGQGAIVPQYELYVGEIDALVKAICDVSGINAKAFMLKLPEPGQTYLRYQNQETGLF
jgi:hypothetical protein